MSMITATYPLAGLQSEMPSATVAAKRPLGFWATLGWFGIATLTFFAASIGVGFGYGLWWAITHQGAALNVNSPVFENLITAVAMPAAALMLVLGARKAGWSALDYLGLVLPSWRQVLVGFGSLVAFGFALTGMSYVFPSVDQSAVMTNAYSAAAGSTTGLVLFWLVLVVTAPIAEEVIFRGFLFRGWSATWLGGVGALMLTSLIFGAIHLQYSVPGMIAVFGLGLMFGLVRWRTGSTVLAIMMHGAWNLMVGISLAMSV